jgi:hypothetical protein
MKSLCLAKQRQLGTVLAKVYRVVAQVMPGRNLPGKFMGWEKINGKR